MEPPRPVLATASFESDGLQFRDRQVFVGDARFRKADGSEFLIFARALRTIEASLLGRRGVECIGLLGGRLFYDSVGQYVVITSAVAAEAPEATADDVVCTPDEFRSMARRLEQIDPPAERVGWWHSHPNDSADLSRTDLLTQANWTAPMSMALLVGVGSSATPTWLRAWVGPGAEPLERVGTPVASDVPVTASPAKVRRRRTVDRSARVLAALALLLAAGSLAVSIWTLRDNATTPEQPLPSISNQTTTTGVAP